MRSTDKVPGMRNRRIGHRISHDIILLVVLACLSLPGNAYDGSADLSQQNISEQDFADREYWMPPGQLISVGTHRLHLFCQGPRQPTEGRTDPTVVIDSGLGGFSLEWRKLQNTLAEQFHVCTYDRAGYGWSDPGPFPRTTKTIVTELRRLLANADIDPPYILAGHSFGGYNMMYFAKEFPENVAGLALIDSSHPEQVDWFPAVYPELNQSRRKQRFVSIPRIPENYPQGLHELGFHLMNTRKARRALRFESMNFEISAQQVLGMGELPQVPLAVLTRGERAWPDTPEGETNETNWVRLQNNLARMVEGSTHVMASFSSHFIHLDQPLLVKEAIDEIAEKFQCQQRIQPANVPVYAQIKNEVKHMTKMISLAVADVGLNKTVECI